MNVYSYRKALQHHCCASLSHRKIAKLTGLSTNTVRKIRQVAELHSWNWQSVQEMNDNQLERAFHGVRDRESGKVVPDWVLLHTMMQAKHQTLIQLWEEYRDQHKSNAYSYSQFTHYYREFIEKVDITMRQVHFAGDCAFVDYAGQTIPWFDEAQGREQKAQVFVGVLGCSNYIFACATASQKLYDWVEAHNQMFQFFCGVPKTVVPDNLKSAVTTPGSLPVLNKTYEEQSEHYGFTIVPARVRRPQDKAKAEQSVKMVTRWVTVPLMRRRFFSLQEVNLALAELLVKLNLRSFKRLPGNRFERFKQLDKPALNSLPVEQFEYGDWVAAQKVGPDYHVYLVNHAYSVPWRLVGERVEGRINATTVAFFHLGKCIATHPRDDSPGVATTEPNHRPPAHQAYAAQTATRFLEWAHELGMGTTQLVEAQFRGKPDFSIVGSKACQQVQLLAKRYGNERLEAACVRALAIQSPTVKSLRSILQHRLDDVRDSARVVTSLVPVHANVRGSSYYSGGSRHE